MRLKNCWSWGVLEEMTGKIASGGLRVGCMKWPGLGYDYEVCD